MHLKKIVGTNFAQAPRQPNQKMQMYRCKHCTQIYAHHVTRMAKHLVKQCRGCPQMIKDQIRRTIKSKREKKNPSKSDSSDSESEMDVDLSHNSGAETDADKENMIAQHEMTDSHSSTVKSTWALSEPMKIKNFCDRMSKKDIDQTQKLLAKAIYSSGTPLNMTDNPHWQELFRHLRPAFPLPSRRQISEKYLDDVFADVKTKADEKVMAADCIGLQCDGWSNIRNEGIVNIILTTPEPVFFKSVPTGGNSETGAYIASEMIKLIDEIGPSKVLGICTDNVSAMKAAWHIVGEHYGANSLVFYGCVAHTLNLLIKDVMKLPTVDVLTKNVKSITKDIKHSHLLSATFSSIQVKDPKAVKRTLKLPVITRWGSIVTCLQSFLEYKHNLQALAIDPTGSRQLNQTTKILLLDEEFWMRARKILDLLEPVASWIKSLEGDTPKLSYVPEAFLGLEQHFENELVTAPLSPLSLAESAKAIAALQSRRSMALTPVHLAANILYPSFKGKHLSEEDHVAGTGLIHQMVGKFGLNMTKTLSELANYNCNEGLWKQPYIQKASKSTSASKWWKGFCHKTDLSKLAQSILSLPASSAATERSSSTHGWIHSAKRNRLTARRAAMIAYISYNMRLFNDNRPKKKTDNLARASLQAPKESESSVISGESESEESLAETEYADVEYLLDDAETNK